MLRMMISFAKDYFAYKGKIKKQNDWIRKYAEKNNFAINPDPMISTNLKIWLSEMEGIYEKRMCPCFDPSGIKENDQKLICPCPYIKEEMEEYGTCHCALFGRPDLSKEAWKASGKRLMKEYRVPLNYKDGILDTRGMPMDVRRNLPIPDASHQLKSTLQTQKVNALTMIVATKQESLNIEKIAKYKNYQYQVQQKDDAFHINLKIK